MPTAQQDAAQLPCLLLQQIVNDTDLVLDVVLHQAHHSLVLGVLLEVVIEELPDALDVVRQLHVQLVAEPEIGNPVLHLFRSQVAVKLQLLLYSRGAMLASCPRFFISFLRSVEIGSSVRDGIGDWFETEWSFELRNRYHFI